MIDRLSALFESEANLRLAVLFGSTARGTAGPSSDIDIAVLPAGPMTLADELDLERRIESATGRPVDVARIDLADPVLRWRIARDGVVLLANPAFEAPRFFARAASEHDELAPLLEDASRRYAARIARAP